MTIAGSRTQEVPVPLLQRRTIKKLAVFRALQLGDMLCAVPALRALRTSLPHAHITLVGLPWAQQFAGRFHRYIDDFVAFPGHPAFPEQIVRQEGLADFYQAMRAHEFDLALQMHGNGEISNQIVGAFGSCTVAGYVADNASVDPECFLAYPNSGAEPLRLLRLTQFLGAQAAGTHLEFPVTEQDETELRESGVAAGFDPGNYICIHPGARLRNKCWAPQRFAEVADRLFREFGLPVVLTGSGQEIDLTTAVAAYMQSPALNAAAPISIGAMAALMKHARLLICNDTGVSHIAAGLRLPSVVIFSIADMERWAPLDHGLHRCIRDPEGVRAADVVEQACTFLRVRACT